MVANQLQANLLEIQRFHPGAAGFGLNQHDGPQVIRAGAAFLIGELVQGVAAANGVGQTLLPVRLGFEHDRQLDHFLRLQLGSGDAVQHVAGRAFQVGRGGQFHHAAGAEARQHVEGQFGAAVVRLIHHHEGPAQAQHVGQRARRRAFGGSPSLNKPSRCVGDRLSKWCISAPLDW